MTIKKKIEKLTPNGGNCETKKPIFRPYSMQTDITLTIAIWLDSGEIFLSKHKLQFSTKGFNDELKI